MKKKKKKKIRRNKKEKKSSLMLVKNYISSVASFYDFSSIKMLTEATLRHCYFK